jgi:hypothetical protein
MSNSCAQRKLRRRKGDIFSIYTKCGTVFPILSLLFPIPAVVCLKEKEEARVNQTRNQFASLAPKFNGQKGRGNDVDFVDCLGYRDDVLALLQL